MMGFFVEIVIKWLEFGLVEWIFGVGDDVMFKI